jgi:SagB-type dehydrogenase family enzyme
VDLRRADLDRLRATDPPLTAVLEARRSVRGGDDARPLTVDQLGEFLDRCAGVRAEWTDGGAELSRRPYPSGGALHELTLYLAVRRVAGLDPGLYRHDPYGHRLERVAGDVPPVRRMLDLAGAAAAAGPPQVLVVVAARFGRLLAKYRAFGYALVLKHVGVLTQVMYAVATAMELAPCALGTGDGDAFAAATGADPLVEAAVGELALGSLPAGWVPPVRR